MRVSRTHKPEDLGLVEWQRLLRTEYGEHQDFILENRGYHPIFSDFSLTNPQSQKSYKVAIRGDKPGDNYCSCPDFQINTLGTCKHIAFTLNQLLKMQGAKGAFAAGYVPPFSEVFLSYGLKKEVRFRPGNEVPAELISLGREFFDEDGRLKEDRILDFPQFLDRVPRNNGHEVRYYDDVMAYIAEQQDREHRRRIVEDRLKQSIDSPIMNTVLKTDLYPYQKEGALFALQTGRCLLGDDMGLGKTIQALAAAELMIRFFHIGKVLIVSPTSLKYQWKGEIERFTDRKATIIEGLNYQRLALYGDDAVYKLINYELVWRDMEMIRQWAPDLIILDEAQRIKNWKTRTAKYVKQLESSFAMVLTGTPIENRIEELHSIMEFIDRHHLGPLYRFIHAHRILDKSGKVVGYQNLESVRRSLEGIMIRRKKEDVLKQLPDRVDKHFFVPMTKEQRDIHDENYEIVVRLVAKWRRYKFLSEADQRRMQIALSMMRMAADNTYLVDKKTVHGPKIEELATLLQELVVEGREKVVIFSQWLRMTELVERVLVEKDIGYVHLNGMVPSKHRKDLMTKFREDPDCKVFLSTDAGGVGLNLQSGSVVINMDIPWNPAVLEQRIGRVHRLGQRRLVRVVNFVTKASIEERILDLLKFKKALFTGVLDEGGQDSVMIGESQIKRFMETVGAVTDNLERPDPAADRQEQMEIDEAMETMDREEAAEEEMDEPSTTTGGAVPRDAAGQTGVVPLGHLLMKGAEFLSALGQTLVQSSDPPHKVLERHLETIVSKDETTGKSYLKIPIPEPETLQGLLSSLGGLLAGVFAKKQG
jgi:superfamily II DNA or RNA helicase